MTKQLAKIGGFQPANSTQCLILPLVRRRLTGHIIKAARLQAKSGGAGSQQSRALSAVPGGTCTKISWTGSSDLKPVLAFVHVQAAGTADHIPSQVQPVAGCGQTY